MDPSDIERRAKRWSTVDMSQIKMTEGAGVVALPQENGLIWIATRVGAGSNEFIGNAYRPEAARDFARELLAHADEVDLNARTTPGPPGELDKN